MDFDTMQDQFFQNCRWKTVHAARRTPITRILWGSLKDSSLGYRPVNVSHTRRIYTKSIPRPKTTWCVFLSP